VSRGILFLITDLKYGGTPRSVQALVLGLRENGYQVRVVSLLEGGEIAGELQAAGISVSGLGLDSRPLAAAWEFFSLLRRERPLILHTFLFHANLLGRIFGRLAGVPFIIASERSAEPSKTSARVWLDHMTWRLATIWTANAEAVATTLERREGIDRRRIAVIPTAVDTDRFSPRAADPEVRRNLGVSPDETLLISIGRLDTLKGHATLIEAFGLVAARRSNVRLALIGEGAEQASLEAQAAATGLDGRVTFLGGRADVVPYLRAADVFVLASNTEGMPGAVLEAMAVGLPVVATAVGGTPEVVVDGQTGVLVPPRDAAAFAAAILHLLEDPEQARAMGARARVRATERFSIRNTIALTKDLYARIAGLRAAA
jgi:glycosyltransferase involved in cell wall biosynthesis